MHAFYKWYLKKESLNSDDHQFHYYQQNKQSFLFQLLEHKNKYNDIWPHFCACPKPGPVFPTPLSVVFGLLWRVIVHYVDWTFAHHCLSFLFIIYRKSSTSIWPALHIKIIYLQFESLRYEIISELLKIDEFVIIVWSTDTRHIFHLTYKYKLK